MQFWKGQRVQHKGQQGTVYQDQGLDQTVKVVFDAHPNVVESLNPRSVYIFTSKAEEDAMHNWLNRTWLP